MIDFDTLRAKYPHLGYAVYAYEPGGVVTLECITANGKSFKFTGSTLADAIRAGFPEDSIEPEPAPAESAAAEPASVFD
ncbi:hypothetical protein XM25_00750 [Devosia sp. H5989]|nr:hypothetical protein XM25_00750 [Devosia sp. H5989]